MSPERQTPELQAAEHSSELDWQAFCYAADELSPAAAAAFEQRLADEQPAREALARAVGLSQAAASACQLQPVAPASSPHAGWNRRLAWMALGAAASLLGALLWNGGLPGNWPALESRPASGLTHELAAAWSETRQELADTNEGSLWYPAHLESAAGNDFSGEDSDETTAAPFAATAPSWLTAAVLSSAGLPVDGDATPFDGQRSDN